MGPPARIPQGALKQVAHYLGAVEATERELRDALVLVAERHERNYELSHGATTLAIWSTDHLRWLKELTQTYGTAPYEHAALLRSALLGGTRVGVVGELADACDLAALVQHAEMLWTVIVQGARELHDDTLLNVASRGREHSRRQLAWLRTIVEHEAPDAIAIVPDQSGQIATSLPKRPTSVASIPDPIWGSLAAAALLLVVGLLGVLVGLPWLVPSLGPSAVLLAVTPAHPTARPWNTIVGHAGGMVSGFAAVAVLGAATAPTVLGDHQLVPVRVAAAVLAIGLTVGAGFLLRASHPPAAATTLLVALGSIATLEQGLVVLAGVVILTGVGEFLRELRRQRVAPGERMAPRRSVLEQRLRGG
jgi:HPP family